MFYYKRRKNPPPFREIGSVLIFFRCHRKPTLAITYSRRVLLLSCFSAPLFVLISRRARQQILRCSNRVCSAGIVPTRNNQGRCTSSVLDSSGAFLEHRTVLRQACSLHRSGIGHYSTGTGRNCPWYQERSSHFHLLRYYNVKLVAHFASRAYNHTTVIVPFIPCPT